MNSWAGERVFITGIDGFVGSHIARRLVELGAIVSGTVHRPKSPLMSHLPLWELGQRVEQCPGDICDFDFVSYCLREHAPKWIVHLAAQAVVGSALSDPLHTFESNVRGTYNILCASRDVAALNGIIVASSDKAYGPPVALPLIEEMPLRPVAPYDASKASADLMAHSFAQTYGLPIAVTRCSNIYGPGDLHFSRIVPDTVRSLLKNEAPVIRGHGKHARDYLYIDDAVRGYLSLAEQIDEMGVAGEAFNFGSGSPVKVVDLVKKIIVIAGRDHLRPIVLGRPSEHEIEAQYVDSSRAEARLGWKPDVTLCVGLGAAFIWYQSFFEKKADEDEAT